MVEGPPLPGYLKTAAIGWPTYDSPLISTHRLRTTDHEEAERMLVEIGLGMVYDCCRRSS